MFLFCINNVLQSSKKANSLQRDILHMSMNTHIIMHA